MNKKKIKFVFFGTPEFSTIILNELKKEDYLPSLIITAQNKPIGRKHVVTSPPVKEWGEKNNIEVWQVNHPKEVIEKLRGRPEELYIVASYGYIIPKSILDIPKYGILNVHTSLLPKYRGASPIESALLNGDKETGSTIIKMIYKMDAGPILKQTIISLNNTITKPELFNILAHDGGKLLAGTIEPYFNGEILEQEQDEAQVSYCGKLTKEDANLTDIKNNLEKWNRYRAFHGWPGSFIFDGDIRLKIVNAVFENERFIIKKIIPAGKKEITYKQYLENKK